MTKPRLHVEIVGLGTDDPGKKNGMYFMVCFRPGEQTVRIPASQITEKVLEESQRLGIDLEMEDSCVPLRQKPALPSQSKNPASKDNRQKEMSHD